MKNLVKARLEQKSRNDHVWVTVECPGSPTISIDIANVHGRRLLSVRSNGMGLGGLLVDIEALPAKSDQVIHRFCPFCGDETNLISSKPHKCKCDDD